MTDRANVLLVDDRPENLITLEAILAPLGHRLVTASSGEEALRHLLHDEFAVILLDVQMPELDGFATAELIKQRERTRHVPIIFLTAHVDDGQNVFRGYSAGAVDYLLKPFDPAVLRSKVAVFVDLWEKGERLRAQEKQLREQALAEAVRESEQRYRTLAEAMPQIVWSANADGEPTYYNRRWYEYTGAPEGEVGAGSGQRVFHPDDAAETLERWRSAARNGTAFETEYRLRRADGEYRWHLARAVPVYDETGSVVGWVGTATDIDDKRRAEDAQRFLLEVGALLGSSLDFTRTLADVAQAAVPAIADWCTVVLADPDGRLRQVAIAHDDPRKVQFVRELQERYPPDRNAPYGPTNVVRTGEPELMAEISDDTVAAVARDELHLDLLRELGLRSYMCVPIATHDRVLGAITFITAESNRRYGREDLALAEELARRAAIAIENARLYSETEERAQAARVLAAVGDGVALVDRDGVVRLWNPAAHAITGVEPQEILGRPLLEVIPGWREVENRAPVAVEPGAAVRAETVPLEIARRELWLSISGVGYDEGTVYAFRDLTDERALETMKSDFVATVSHELRTPLAAIHGAALTIMRGDLELEPDIHNELLRIISEESNRLAEIVNDLLLASHLDSGRLDTRIERCDGREIAASVIDAARTHVPEGVSVELNAPARVPAVAADAGQLHQVLRNLVDNAVKYSPDGGRVEVRLEPDGSHVRFSVADRGLGIPEPELGRIFEKFYRLDPGMTRGIGGTGLGLYICRELVRTMQGRIWVESEVGVGSTFFVEIPQAETPRKRPRRRPAAHARS